MDVTEPLNEEVIEIDVQDSYDDDLEPTSEPMISVESNREDDDEATFVVKSSHSNEMNIEEQELKEIIAIVPTRKAFKASETLRLYFQGTNQENQLDLRETC